MANDNICDNYGWSTFKVMFGYAVPIGIVLSLLTVLVFQLCGEESLPIVLPLVSIIGFVANTYFTYKRFKNVAESCRKHS